MCKLFDQALLLVRAGFYLFIHSALVHAEPRILTPADDSVWTRIEQRQISRNGNWFGYLLVSGEGSANAVFRSTTSNQAEWRIPVSASTAETPRARIFLAENGQFAVVQTGSETGEVIVLELSSGRQSHFRNISGFKFISKRLNWIALSEVRKDGSQQILLRQFPSKSTRTFTNASGFEFDKSGTRLAIIQRDSQGRDQIVLRELEGGQESTLAETTGSFHRLTWAPDSGALAVLQNDRVNGVSLKVWRFNQPTTSPVEITSAADGLNGWTISQDFELSWRGSANLLFFGVRKTNNIGDAIHGDRGTRSTLRLWHWMDTYLPSELKVQQARKKALDYLASFSLEASAPRVVRIADERLSRIYIGPTGHWGIAADMTPYLANAGVTGHVHFDLIAIDLMSGVRRIIEKKVPGARGAARMTLAEVLDNTLLDFRFSPNGGWFVYFSRGDWKAVEFDHPSPINLTRQIPARFWKVHESNGTQKERLPEGLLGWSSDSLSVLLRDSNDLWWVSVQGGSWTRVTADASKRISYSLLNRAHRINLPIDKSQPLYLKTTDLSTKAEGVALLEPGQRKPRQLFSENAALSAIRAENANVWFLSRETVTQFPDWYSTFDFQTFNRLTQANPQQSAFAWTSGVKLVNHKCRPGGRLQQALLYLPANYSPGKSYATIVTVYRNFSDDLHKYHPPSAGPNANISIFTSQGYAILAPDVEYRLNDPGRSALDCVLSSLNSAITTGVVDRTRVGLYGHSLGGLASAFISTQTNRFKAAVAGSPPTDLSHLFGGIYHDTGAPNSSVFLSRLPGHFTGSPQDIPKAYERNSPWRFAKSLNTPLLILGSEHDEQVGFDQAVTFFNLLRYHRKQVVLLEYLGESHNLQRRENRLDYSQRVLEWFDTYLRDSPSPRWIREGRGKTEE